VNGGGGISEAWRFVSIGLFFSALLGLTFLAMLNGSLNGRFKAHIDAALSVLLVGLIGFAFYDYGWKSGIFVVFVCFIYAVFLLPLARQVAAYFLAHPPKR
jgi:hypothetical protein